MFGLVVQAEMQHQLQILTCGVFTGCKRFGRPLEAQMSSQMTNDCHDMLTEHSEEVRGATLPNFVGDRVFNGIFAERKLSQYSSQNS